MALASAADFFLAFGDGLIRGHASMPSMLVLQMRRAESSIGIGGVASGIPSA